MTAQNWSEFVKNVTYKPGFSVSYDYDIDRNHQWLTLATKVVDSRNPDRLKLVPVVMKRLLYPWQGEEEAKSYMRYLFREMEDHEMDEWFRYEGELVNDPHANEQRIAS